MSPDNQSLVDCYKWRMDCQADRRKDHQEVMGAIGELRDYVAAKRGEELGTAKAEAKAERDKATSAQKPVGNSRKSWVTNLGLKILEWVIITAIIGGLMYALRDSDKSLAAAPGPAPVAKP